ncbi:MAG: hypothetical protein ACRDRS_05460 [Pseudonocardiaceae bacterium]
MQPTGEGVSFLEAAQQGTFVIDTVAAEQIKHSIAEVRGKVTKQLKRIDDLKMQGILGDLDEAKAIESRDTLVAIGDSQSLDFALNRFDVVLDDLQQAVELCLGTYEQDDAQSAHTLRQLGAG